METKSMADQPESFDRQITQEILDDFTINPEKYSVLEFQEIELARNTQLLANQFAMIARDKKAKIPESVFISTFLPIFFGRIIHRSFHNFEISSIAFIGDDVKIILIMFYRVF